MFSHVMGKNVSYIMIRETADQFWLSRNDRFRSTFFPPLL